MLTPDAVFAAGNWIALAAWVALAATTVAAGLRSRVWPVTGVALPGLFAIAYVGSIVAAFAGGGQGGFGSIAEVRQLFANDHALAAGWLHYLAFDLVVGTLIARDAARLGVSPLFVVPALLLTFLFGPAGLLVHLVVRFAKGGRLTETLT